MKTLKLIAFAILTLHTVASATVQDERIDALAAMKLPDSAKEMVEDIILVLKGKAKPTPQMVGALEKLHDIILEKEPNNSVQIPAIKAVIAEFKVTLGMPVASKGTAGRASAGSAAGAHSRKSVIADESDYVAILTSLADSTDIPDDTRPLVREGILALQGKKPKNPVTGQVNLESLATRMLNKIGDTAHWKDKMGFSDEEIPSAEAKAKVHATAILAAAKAMEQFVPADPVLPEPKSKPSSSQSYRPTPPSAGITQGIPPPAQQPAPQPRVQVPTPAPPPTSVVPTPAPPPVPKPLPFKVPVPKGVTTSLII